jgi:hypothetical protein
LDRSDDVAELNNRVKEATTRTSEGKVINLTECWPASTMNGCYKFGYVKTDATEEPEDNRLKVHDDSSSGEQRGIVSLRTTDRTAVPQPVESVSGPSSDLKTETTGCCSSTLKLARETSACDPNPSSSSACCKPDYDLTILASPVQADLCSGRPCMAQSLPGPQVEELEPPYVPPADTKSSCRTSRLRCIPQHHQTVDKPPTSHPSTGTATAIPCCADDGKPLDQRARKKACCDSDPLLCMPSAKRSSGAQGESDRVLPVKAGTDVDGKYPLLSLIVSLE